LKLQLRHQPDHYVTLRTGLVSIGSDPSNQLVVRAEGVSDFHAEISVEGDRIFIADLLSSQGTYVNGQKVGTRAELAAWDVVRLGAAELELNDPAVARPTLWALEIIHPDGHRERMDLNEVTTIGRDAGCGITLASDLLSRRHAEVRPVRDYLEITDLGSANGTFLNGRRITSTLAYVNDELQIDPYRFLVRGPDGAGDAGDRTIIKSTAFADEEDATELIDTNAATAYLEEQSSLLSNGQIPLKNPLSIGRLPTNDLVIDDRSVSKQHARVGFENGQWVIEDCNSSNGIKLNGAPVQRAILNPNDEIQFGRATFRLKSGTPQGTR
jgi:pSer/pThr/pTyr-binding forkhead associated (FHA) protein